MRGPSPADSASAATWRSAAWPRSSPAPQARKVDVEPLVDGPVGQAVRACRARSKCSAATSKARPAAPPPPIPAGRVEVRGQVAGRDGPRVPPVERRRESVQADTPAGRQVADDGLPYEGVRECEAVEGTRRPDELRLLGRFERVEGALGIDAARRRDYVGVELVPRHGCDLQQLDDAGREAGEPPAHDVADARGDGPLGGVALSERANHLPDEERVPLGDLSDPGASEGARPASPRMSATSRSVSGASSSRLTSGRRARPVTTAGSSGERPGSESR